MSNGDGFGRLRHRLRGERDLTQEGLGSLYREGRRVELAIRGSYIPMSAITHDGALGNSARSKPSAEGATQTSGKFWRSSSRPR